MKPYFVRDVLGDNMCRCAAPCCVAVTLLLGLATSDRWLDLDGAVTRTDATSVALPAHNVILVAAPLHTATIADRRVGTANHATVHSSDKIPLGQRLIIPS